MSEHEHPLAREVVSLTIGRFQADGTAVIRRWHLHACCAEALAADSGHRPLRSSSQGRRACPFVST